MYSFLWKEKDYEFRQKNYWNEKKAVANLYLLNKKEKLARKKYKEKINLDWMLNCKRLCKVCLQCKDLKKWKNIMII